MIHVSPAQATCAQTSCAHAVYAHADCAHAVVEPGRTAVHLTLSPCTTPVLNTSVAVLAGVRPKLSGPGQPPADFMIQGAEGVAGHGVKVRVCAEALL